MKSHLKVKVVSMSAEMTYIRRQEAKWKARAKYARQKQKQQSVEYAEKNFWSHHEHRYVLKVEARIAHLAYGALKGTPYSQMEYYCHGWRKGYAGSEPDWKAIEITVERFTKDEPSPQDHMQRFAEWLAEAKAWYEGNDKRWQDMQKMREALHNGRLADTAYQAELTLRNAAAKARGLEAAK